MRGQNKSRPARQVRPAGPLTDPLNLWNKPRVSRAPHPGTGTRPLTVTLGLTSSGSSKQSRAFPLHKLGKQGREGQSQSFWKLTTKPCLFPTLGFQNVLWSLESLPVPVTVSWLLLELSEGDGVVALPQATRRVSVPNSPVSP